MTHDNRIYQYLSRLFVIYLPKNVVVWLAMFWFSRLGAHNNFYFENRLDSHGCVQNPNHASHVSVCSWCDFWRYFFLGWKSSHLQLGMFLCLRSIISYKIYSERHISTSIFLIDKQPSTVCRYAIFPAGYNPRERTLGWPLIPQIFAQKQQLKPNAWNAFCVLCFLRQRKTPKTSKKELP